ncbi:MAG: hypothetical protein QXS54_02540 [Candidatus Methanomethylicaceae archaeon]
MLYQQLRSGVEVVRIVGAIRVDQAKPKGGVGNSRSTYQRHQRIIQDRVVRIANIQKATIDQRLLTPVEMFDHLMLVEPSKEIPVQTVHSGDAEHGQKCDKLVSG